MQLREFKEEYKAWHAAKTRCANPRHHAFARYGGRGIYMCDRWLADWRNFITDMGPKPKGTSLERVDNNGPYSPDNCVWATRKQQQNNRSVCMFLTHDGQTMTASQWAEKLGIDNTTLLSRLKRGWSVERALSTGKSTREMWSPQKQRAPLTDSHKAAISRGVRRHFSPLLDQEAEHVA